MTMFLFILSAYTIQSASYNDKVYRDVPVFEGEVTIVQPVEQIINFAYADNFRNFITPLAFLEWGVIVLEAQGDTLWATRTESTEPWVAWIPYRRTGELLKSTDHGESWALIYEFSKPVNAIYADDFGNIFVTVTYDRWAYEGTGELHKSSDGGETFRKVLDIESGVPLRWNIASRDGTMFVSEYGFKGVGNNARRIYRSFDFGETWETIFEPEPIYNFHHHKTLVTDDGIVYQSTGDYYNSKIIRSLDNGYSWDTMVYGLNPTSAVVFDTYILWGLDNSPWHGIARYDRQTGEISNALTLPYPFAGSCYDMAIAHGVVYALFLSYGGYEHSASIFFSEDEGATWNLLGSIGKFSTFGVGLYNLVVDERFGYIDIGTPVHQDGAISFFVGTLRFELLNIEDYEEQI